VDEGRTRSVGDFIPEFLLVLWQCWLGDKKRMRLIKKNLYGKGSLLEQVEKKTKGYWLTHTTTVLRPFFRDHLGEPVLEQNFWTLWCKGRLTEADTYSVKALKATSAFGLGRRR